MSRPRPSATYTGQIAKVFAARGRPELAVPLYEKLAPYRKVEGFRAGLAVMLLESGEPERARDIYDELMDLGPENLSRNPAYLHTLGFLASLCAAFGDRAGAPSIEAVLLRRIATCGSSPVRTSTGRRPHFLARLADVQGHTEQARANCSPRPMSAASRWARRSCGRGTTSPGRAPPPGGARRTWPADCSTRPTSSATNSAPAE